VEPFIRGVAKALGVADRPWSLHNRRESQRRSLQHEWEHHQVLQAEARAQVNKA
jgi:hypothetical protein